MKNKNIKNYYRKRIVHGWRSYITLNFTYEMLGLKREDHMTREDITKYLELEFNEDDDSGLVDHYDLIDRTITHKGQPLNVFLNFDCSYHKDILLEQYPDVLYVERNGKYYYLEGTAGIRNPNYKPNNNEPYWLYKDDEEFGFRKWYFSTGEDPKDVAAIKELITKHVNNKQFSEDLFSGDFIFAWLSGNHGQNIENPLLKDLSKLAHYCKTTYEEFTPKGVEITFAIRYKDSVDDFLSDMKKIIQKHKLPNLNHKPVAKDTNV